MLSSRRTPRLTAVVAIAATCATVACAPKADTVADSTVAAVTDTFPSQEGMIDVPGGKVWYRRIGNGPGEGGCELHNANYDFNDAILPAASGYLAGVAKRALGG